MADDETATVDALKSHRALFRAQVAEHGGRVVDAVGDNVLAEFPSVVDAVSCAVSIQRRVAEANARDAPERRLRFRIGVHAGDVLVDEASVYGTSVNVAARLEGLATPGGVAISDAVYQQIQGRLALDVEDFGEQQLKNIPEPVRVHRIRVDEADASPSELECTGVGLAARPALAVLPFDAGGDAPALAELADGITEELTARLSRRRMLPVIAYASSSVYRRRSADLRQVGADLGARYVVRGSVRGAGDRLRILAELADTAQNRQIWAERYEGDRAGSLALQEEIALSITASIFPAVLRNAEEDFQRTTRPSAAIWEQLLRGLSSLRRGGRQEVAAAREAFEALTWQAPELSQGWSHLASCYLIELINGWTDDLGQWRDQANRAAERACALEAGDPEAHHVLGALATHRGRLEAAVECFEHALELDPSHVHSLSGLGQALAGLGRAEEGVASIQRAIRLSPRDPLLPHFLADLAVAHFVGGRDSLAVRCLEKSRRLAPLSPGNRALLAAAYAWMGRPEARDEVGVLHAQFPFLTLEVASRLARRISPAGADRIVAGLRRAGLRESQ